MPDALSDAKAALEHANNFAGGVKSETDKVAPAPAAAPVTAKPSYTAARAQRSGGGLATELSEKAKMVANAKKALAQ